jgi:hypothetical protein
MRNRVALCAIIALLGFALSVIAGCNGSYSSSTNTSPTQNSGGLTASLSPVSLSMTDAPPAGVTIFSFEVKLTSAVLNPGAIDLLAGKGPLDIEIKRLETETALLNTANVPAGTYTTIQLTFANPQLTFRNDSGGSLTVGGTVCAVGAVCEVTPTGSLSTTINLPAAGTPVGFIVDVNLANLFNGDMTLNFGNANSASLQRVPLSTVPTGQVEKLEEVEGIVKNLNTTTGHFTLQTPARGNLDVAVNSTTRFADCSANTLAGCVQNDQAAEVDLGLLAGGVLYARKIEVEDTAANAVDDGIEGFIYQIDDATHFRMVADDFLRGSDPSIVRGRRLIVALRSGAKFDVASGGLAFPPAIQTAVTAFDSATTTAQLQIGQHVQVRFRLLTPAPPPTPFTLETDRVRLTGTRLSATIGTITGSTFTVTGLPPVFGAGATIQVFTSSDTDFENATRIGDLSTGAQVSLRGFLFKLAVEQSHQFTSDSYGRCTVTGASPAAAAISTPRGQRRRTLKHLLWRQV